MLRILTKFSNLFLKSKYLILFICSLAFSIIFTFFLYPNLEKSVTNYPYKLGDVVDRDIKSPKAFFVEDHRATAIDIKSAEDKVLPVYIFDISIFLNIKNVLNRSFEKYRQIFIEAQKKQDSDKTIVSPVDFLWQQKKVFEEDLGVTLSNPSYQTLIKANFSQEILDSIFSILKTIMTNGIVSNKTQLLEREGLGITLISLNNLEENTIVTDLKRFYDLDQANKMVRIEGEKKLVQLHHNIRDLVVEVVQKLLKVNMYFDDQITERKKNEVRSKVAKVLLKVKKKEMIAREGDIIKYEQLIKIQELQRMKQIKKFYISNFGVLIIVLLFLFFSYQLFLENQEIEGKHFQHNINIIFIISTLVLFLTLSKIAYVIPKELGISFGNYLSPHSLLFITPIAAGAMLVCLFINLRVALIFSVLMSTLLALIFAAKLEVFVFSLLSLGMGSFWIQSGKERQSFIKTGLKIGLLNVVIALSINIYLAEVHYSKMITDSTLALIGGIFSGIMTAGFIPLIEIVFGYVSDIKLLELGSLDREIFKQLMVKAPGTYNHSAVVGTLAEAAAAGIGANSLVAKVGGYYHDIGKINKAQYFIENQGKKNKHDSLSPSMSVMILQSHVKDGLAIAKKYKLGRKIESAIAEHHGTNVIKFFYDKAKQEAIKNGTNQKINDSDFRYTGPKPQTKETGIIMLADIVEASAKTLSSPTQNNITILVKETINKTFLAGQLDECNLTLRDLGKISDAFVQILTGHYHHRIEYPDETKDAINADINFK